MSGEEEEGSAPDIPADVPGGGQLPDPLARTVADSYAEILKEPVPERLSSLLDTIRRFEAGQRKPN